MMLPYFDLSLHWDRPAHVTGSDCSLRDWFISAAWHHDRPRTAVDRGDGAFYETHWGAGITVLGLSLTFVLAIPRAKW